MTEIIEQNFNDENEIFLGEINRKNDINDVRKSSKNDIVIENNLNEQDITDLLAEVIAERILENQIFF